MTLIVILSPKNKIKDKLPNLSKGILIIISPFGKKGTIDIGSPFIKNIFIINGKYIPNQLIIF
jgi:hypothetical protein